MARFITTDHAKSLANEHTDNKSDKMTTISIQQSKRDALERLRKLKSLTGEQIKQKDMVATAVEQYLEREIKKIPAHIADMFK
ncbi:MAG: hypothetical protein ACRCZQ_10245 [Bacteroidales bacterium]